MGILTCKRTIVCILSARLITVLSGLIFSLVYGTKKTGFKKSKTVYIKLYNKDNKIKRSLQYSNAKFV